MRFNKNEAWSFGISSRSTSQKKDVPGPGNYETKILGRSSPKWK